MRGAKAERDAAAEASDEVSRLRDGEVFGPGTPNPRLPKPPKPQLFVAIRGGELVPVASALDWASRTCLAV